MIHIYLYILGSLFYLAVSARQVKILLESNLKDFFFTSKLFFFTFNLLLMLGFGYAVMLENFKAAGMCYLATSIISFWTYYLKRQFE